ncbi:MAG: xylulokinase [Planctomycetota bacterium]
MGHLLGIDLGTSSVKAVLINETGMVAAVAQEEYGIDTPYPGWAEQDPETWWRATCAVINEAVRKSSAGPDAIKAIGFSGQMHGAVFLDKGGRPLRPAIIWADQRSAEQCRRIYETVGRKKLAELTCNPVAPGFMAASVLWLKENDPKTFAKVKHVLLPKDYVRYRMTGKVASEPSDACSTLLFDTKNRDWSRELVEALDLPMKILPPIIRSWDVAGELVPDAAAELGLPPGTPVTAGGGDQPIAAIANGVIEPGILLATIGTGGQLFAPLAEPRYDPQLRTHTFCHAAPDRWFIMGAMLSAGLSLRWFRDNMADGVPYAQLSEEAERIPPGSDGLIFLPYLVGERTPHMDPKATGCFVGLTLRHGRAHMARAIMEGVAFAMRDSLEIFRELGVTYRKAIASGGGARSPLWRQIQADVFGVDLVTVDVAEQAGVGAALLAGVGVGVFKNVAEACRRAVSYGEGASPIEANRALYEEKYRAFRALYPRLKTIFRLL